MHVKWRESPELFDSLVLRPAKVDCIESIHFVSIGLLLMQ